MLFATSLMDLLSLNVALLNSNFKPRRVERKVVPCVGKTKVQGWGEPSQEWLGSGWSLPNDCLGFVFTLAIRTARMTVTYWGSHMMFHLITSLLIPRSCFSQLKLFNEGFL